MLLHVESHQRETHQPQVQSYYRLRKKVFHDQLGWQVITQGDIETDELDDQPCTYTLYLDTESRVMGGARLIPTTQMTLLERFFGGLVPDNMSFRSPTVWESSRFCVDHDLAETRMSSGGKRATIALGIGNLDYAMANGITHFVTVIEERMYELSRNYGTDQSLLSNQTIEGANVICALIPVNERNIELANKMRVFIA